MNHRKSPTLYFLIMNCEKFTDFYDVQNGIQYLQIRRILR